MKNVLILHTGGTLMMRGGDPSPLAPDVYTSDLLAELPVLRKVAEIESRILFNLDSSDMQPHHWVELAAVVHDALPSYDGVVVVHGTDTMAYTASALAFLLPGLDRPVVLTGAQRPLVEVRTDARANLVDACMLATMPVPEVGIAFGSKLLRGCRATKLDAWGMNAFGTPSCAPLVELGVTVEIAAHVLPPRTRVPFDRRIEPRVLAARVFPGLDPRLLAGALRTGVRGVVLEAFGAGNVPHLENSLVPVIEEATERDIPVVIASQCARGAVDLSRYQGGSAAAHAGAIGAGTMTSEAALAKLMVALGRATGARVDAARDAFTAPWAGEA
ncbi:MAG: asparaginase [Polyangiales bacterium]